MPDSVAQFGNGLGCFELLLTFFDEGTGEPSHRHTVPVHLIKVAISQLEGWIIHVTLGSGSFG